MPTSFERNLEKYAEVIVKVGLNLQPGQRLLIGYSLTVGGVPLEAAPLVRAITRIAYQGGAPYVDVIWDDEALKLLRFQHAPRDSFGEFHTWKKDAVLGYIERGDALLTIYAPDPDLLKDQDPALVSTYQQTIRAVGRPVLDRISQNRTNWLGVCAPTSAWAAKVLPDTPPEDRIARMWDAIFTLCRATREDPVAAWQDHIRALAVRCDLLNERRYSALKLTGPGTDLTVGLADGHRWLGGGVHVANSDHLFVPNVPTEEVFTMPHRDRVEGVVTATKPLNANGMLIDDFSVTFEGGRVVQAAARVGNSHLQSLLDSDEGARRLGEVALVPHSSPISQSGLLFYNTLYDENASNHIALGNAYKTTLLDSDNLTDDDFTAAGGNRSVIHVDFMIGSGQMDVDGALPDGRIEPVMRGGEWVTKV